MVAKTLLIRLDGTFDLEAAGEVQRTLAGLPEGSEAYLDLSQVRDFHDRAVAVLADALRETRQAVSVRGLRQHQYRMLRYLGVEPGALDPGLSRRRNPAPAAAAASDRDDRG